MKIGAKETLRKYKTSQNRKYARHAFFMEHFNTYGKGNTRDRLLYDFPKFTYNSKKKKKKAQVKQNKEEYMEKVDRRLEHFETYNQLEHLIPAHLKYTHEHLTNEMENREIKLCYMYTVICKKRYAHLDEKEEIINIICHNLEKNKIKQIRNENLEKKIFNLSFTESKFKKGQLENKGQLTNIKIDIFKEQITFLILIYLDLIIYVIINMHHLDTIKSPFISNFLLDLKNNDSSTPLAAINPNKICHTTSRTATPKATVKKRAIGSIKGMNSSTSELKKKEATKKRTLRSR